jgi:hypothetical protein
MPIKKSEKILPIVFVVILLLLTQNACVRASWASFRIRRRRESVSRTPDLEDDATKNNLVHSEYPRVYKCVYLGGQNGNPGQFGLKFIFWIPHYHI